MPNGEPQEKRASARMRAAACAGYALMLLSCQLTVWGGLKLSARTGLALLPLLSWWTVPLLLGLGSTMLVLGALALRGDLPATRGSAVRALPPIGCALTLAGYGTVVAAPPAATVFICAGAVALGAGTGVLLVGWASLFARLERPDAAPLVLLSLFACAAASFAIGALPPAVLELVFMLATLLSTALLLAVEPAPPGAGRTGGKRRSLQDETEAGRAGAFGWTTPATAGGLLREALGAVRNPLFCAAAIAFAVAITRTMTLRTQPDVVGAAGAACEALGALVLLMLFRGRTDAQARLTIPALFRILFPVVATLLLALSFGGEALELPVGAAVYAIYALVSVLMIPACIDLSERKGLPPAAVYGLFAGLVYAVFAVATFVGVRLFAEGGGFGAATSLVATLLVLYVLAMAYALVQRRAAGGGDAAAGAPDADAGGGSVDAVDPVDPIERRCLVLAERFALSPRETDVLIAFAHGRNVSYLAEQLCLSQNTIRSHSKTLYTKLGVHSKQELISLVDEIDAQAER